jgi:hypothetical protein
VSKQIFPTRKKNCELLNAENVFEKLFFFYKKAEFTLSKITARVGARLTVSDCGAKVFERDSL